MAETEIGALRVVVGRQGVPVGLPSDRGNLGDGLSPARWAAAVGATQVLRELLYGTGCSSSKASLSKDINSGLGPAVDTLTPHTP